MDPMAVHCGEHALHFAGKLGTQPLADFYLSECHLRVDLLSPFKKQTVLRATAGGQMGPQDPKSILKMTRWLVEEKGASIMPKDGLGKTAAHAAYKAGHRKVYEYLRGRETIEMEQQKEQQKVDLAKRERQAEQAAEAFLAELEAEEKEEEEEKKKAKKPKKKKQEKGVETSETKEEAEVTVASAALAGAEKKEKKRPSAGRRMWPT